MTRQRVIAGCAAVGVAVVAVQVWAYAAWLTSSPARLRPTSPVPSDVVHHVHLAELTSTIGATVWLTYVGWDWWRRRTLTWPLLWTVAWTCVFWQEPLVNTRHHTFGFNRAFHNLGDWTTHLPFVPDSYTPLPEALVLEGLVFVYLLPLLAIAVAAYLRLLRRWLPTTSLGVLVAIAYLSVVGFDAAFELQGIHQDLLSYHVIGGPAIGGGGPHRWPLLEGFGIGAAWAFPGVLTFLVRDHRRLQLPRPHRWTVLAAIGAVNLAFGAYNAGYLLVMNP